jgi:hypothetical protein
MGLGRRLQDHPRALERAYRLARWSFERLAPLISRVGTPRAERWLRRPEELAKRWIFDCRMCGQCVLHETGMTCPMTCPKQLRNGPCGGVRADGSCEVSPHTPCVWVAAVRRAARLADAGPVRIQAPVDRRLEGTSAWINLHSGADRPALPGWQRAGEPRG